MPELPEVECLTQAVKSTLSGGSITGLQFLRGDLRDPIPMDDLREVLVGQPILNVFRRSKYLLIETPRGCAILHLGMSGNLLRRPGAIPDIPHTHAIITYIDATGREGYLHFSDPRRFGRFDCLRDKTWSEHPFFQALGPEPLAQDAPALGAYLFQASRGRKVPVKNFIMDAKVLVGVGNIYASESLFRAGISPRRKAGSVSQQRYERLAKAIQTTLHAAIAAGGTSFRDFKNTAGEPGYFSVQLNVYGREGQPCGQCQKEIVLIRQGGRATYYCSNCQS